LAPDEDTEAWEDGCMSWLRRILRPVYGERFEVRPKHWWNPRERKTARLAAKLADHHAASVSKEASRLMVDAAVFGVVNRAHAARIEFKNRENGGREPWIRKDGEA
jgi:hypothetical protein